MTALIDTMAQRYHLLPSAVLEQATTWDLRAMFVNNDFQQRRMETEQGTAPPVRRGTSQRLTEEMMTQMMQRARARGVS